MYLPGREAIVKTPRFLDEMCYTILSQNYAENITMFRFTFSFFILWRSAHCFLNRHVNSSRNCLSCLIEWRKTSSRPRPRKWNNEAFHWSAWCLKQRFLSLSLPLPNTTCWSLMLLPVNRTGWGRVCSCIKTLDHWTYSWSISTKYSVNDITYLILS